MAAFLVCAVAELLAHEVVERILVRGQRILDPHASGVPMLARLAGVLKQGGAPSAVGR